MKKIKNEQMIKACIMFSVLVIILIILIGIILRYQEEGEKEVPFYISEMSVISTAEGVGNQGNDTSKWNMNIFQNNDIYLNIVKNEKNYEDKVIQKIVIDQIEIKKAPQKGAIKAFMPNSTEGRTFSYDEKYRIDENLTFNGSGQSNLKTLEIGNQGGTILFRISNSDIGTYESNEDGEVIHNGTILNKIGVTEEEIQFSIAFNLSIYIDQVIYQTNIQLDLPAGNILEEGTSYIDKKDMSDLVYKRQWNR